MRKENFDMQANLDAALKEHFGFDSFRPGQRKVAADLLAGRSAAAVFPTGGGKSLCYQLPALLFDGVTLVVSPLIALMKDQIDALGARGIAASRLDSSLSEDEYRQVMSDLKSKDLRLLYVAPERFNNERFRETILQTRISLFAVDEAHCISEWGHNFRPDYLKLAEFAKRCKAERVLGLTATATPKVLEDICREFDIAPECVTNTGFYRNNLNLISSPVLASQRDRLLIKKLRSRAPGATIIYVTQQRTAEAVAEALCNAGLPAKAYHAGMKDDIRAETQDWFLSSSAGIVVATIAFGMGIDKSDIRYVYHYNLPKSLENYSQEIGRAGRDGGSADCELFVCMEDLNVLENFVYGDTPTRDAVVGMIQDVFSQNPEFDVSYYELSAACDIRVLVVRTLMTYLELLGYLEGGAPFYSQYQFRPLISSHEILQRFDEQRRNFLIQVFRQSQKAKIWFRIDLESAAKNIGVARERIVRALDYLGEKKMLEVKVQGVRNRYRRIKDCSDVKVLGEKLHEKMLERERLELSRLQQVLDLVGGDGCYWTALCSYFGETLSRPCGHCAWCVKGGTAVEIPSRARLAPSDELLRKIEALRKEKYDVLGHPQSIARFLCGVRSPSLSKAKLSSHPLFGAAADIPYSDILRWASA